MWAQHHNTMSYIFSATYKHKQMLFRLVKQVTPGALKEAEGGEIIGRFEEIGFGRSFVDDAEAVELHVVAESVLFTQFEHIRSHKPDYLL